MTVLIGFIVIVTIIGGLFLYENVTRPFRKTVDGRFESTEKNMKYIREFFGILSINGYYDPEA